MDEQTFMLILGVLSGLLISSATTAVIIWRLGRMLTLNLTEIVSFEGSHARKLDQTLAVLRTMGDDQHNMADVLGQASDGALKLEKVVREVVGMQGAWLIERRELDVSLREQLLGFTGSAGEFVERTKALLIKSDKSTTQLTAISKTIEKTLPPALISFTADFERLITGHCELNQEAAKNLEDIFKTACEKLIKSEQKLAKTNEEVIKNTGNIAFDLHKNIANDMHQLVSDWNDTFAKFSSVSEKRQKAIHTDVSEITQQAMSHLEQTASNLSTQWKDELEQLTNLTAGTFTEYCVETADHSQKVINQIIELQDQLDKVWQKTSDTSDEMVISNKRFAQLLSLLKDNDAAFLREQLLQMGELTRQTITHHDQALCTLNEQLSELNAAKFQQLATVLDGSIGELSNTTEAIRASKEILFALESKVAGHFEIAFQELTTSIGELGRFLQEDSRITKKMSQRFTDLENSIKDVAASLEKSAENISDSVDGLQDFQDSTARLIKTIEKVSK